MSADAVLRQKFASVWGLLDERTRRLMAANEALSLGYGGVSLVSRACGLSRNAIARGIEEIADGSSPGVGRIRRAGAGRRPITARDPRLLAALDRLIDPDTRGDPESPLRWICKSTRTLAAHPYGIYDVGRNTGFVNVGTDHDTGAFAVASIRGWWRFEGRRIDPEAKAIVIRADGGGSIGWRLWLWNVGLQNFAEQAGLGV